MKKELLGISLFFLIVFSLVSLLSYNPSDPSVSNPQASGEIHNLFGLLGAHIAGMLVFLFGLGALWIPVILSFASVYLLKNRPRNEMIIPGAGGFILILATGSLFAVGGDFYEIFGNKISSGGVAGIGLKMFIVRYFNSFGGGVILFLLWIIGFIMAAETSMADSWKRLQAAVKFSMEHLEKIYSMWKYRGRNIHDKEELTPISVKPLRKMIRKIQKLEIKASANEEKILIPKKKDTPLLTMKKEIGLSSSGRKKGLSMTEKYETIIQDQNNMTPVSDNHCLSNANEEPQVPEGQNNTSPDKDSDIHAKKSAKKHKFRMPVITFMNEPEHIYTEEDKAYLEQQAQILTSKLEDFNVKGEVTNVIPGPVITTFEYKPAQGVKINKVVNLTDDLALALRAISIRIVAPIPGRAVIGIEVPNEKREIVWLKEVINSSEFTNSKSKLTICLGKDIVGNPVVAQLDKMPHLLIAGATGTGKSVGLNSMICSLLYKSGPEDVKLIMIDPKRIELSMYDGIPHLITPVVTDIKKATNALFWAVKEMERRYDLLSEKKVRNIIQYNRKIEQQGNEDEKLPYIVVIIDELADLMVAASREVEVSLMRLAQMARASGIHLIIATQRPSVDVLTGVIKANFPTRLTFQVSSKIDSRTIIDTNGAQSLLGAGDMLFLPPGTARLQRIHGAYISEDELVKITTFLKSQSRPEYDDKVVEAPKDEEEYDELYDQAVALVTKTGQVSIAMIQRSLRIGYNRAGRIIETMEKEGIIGPSNGSKPREVIAGNYEDVP